MATICQRSPCDRFLQALGRYIFGRPNAKPNYYVALTYVEDSDAIQYDIQEVRLDYCPFCGTRLDDIDEEYMTTKKARARVPVRGALRARTS